MCLVLELFPSVGNEILAFALSSILFCHVLVLFLGSLFFSSEIKREWVRGEGRWSGGNHDLDIFYEKVIVCNKRD